jgi:hypothetical protein
MKVTANTESREWKQKGNWMFFVTQSIFGRSRSAQVLSEIPSGFLLRTKFILGILRYTLS